MILNKYKKTVCKFCEQEIVSKHFTRHLRNKHAQEPAVAEIMATEDSKLKKELIALIRNDGNLSSGLNGRFIPKRLVKGKEINEQTHTFCSDCKAQIKISYLSRHKNICFARKTNKDDENIKRKQELMNSYIFVACQKKYGEIINKMFLKSEVLARMRGDEGAKIILSDILILSWGDDLLKKTPQNRSKYHISAKMRRCANFLLQMRKTSSKYTNMLSCMKQQAFDDVIEAAKQISGFDAETRTYRSASTGLQFGAYLKQLASLGRKLIFCRRFELTNNVNQSLDDLKTFRGMIDDHWATEIASLAKKDLDKKASKKTLILPLTENVMKLKKCVDSVSETSCKALQLRLTESEFTKLAETTLASCILHNRKRVSDVQYIELQDYIEQSENLALESRATEFMESLTETEKILLKNYVKINSIGKGAKAVSVLIPKEHVKYWDMIKKVRVKNQNGLSKTINIFLLFLVLKDGLVAHLLCKNTQKNVEFLGLNS